LVVLRESCADACAYRDANGDTQRQLIQRSSETCTKGHSDGDPCRELMTGRLAIGFAVSVGIGHALASVVQL
jgi:hypothetical protein